MKILHLGDFHLDSAFSGFEKDVADQKREELRNCFARALKIGRERGVELVLISGDTFDTPFCTASTRKAVFDAIATAGCPVVIVPGNHDYYIKNGIPESSFERAKKVLVSQDIKLFNNLEAMGNAFIRSIINGQNPLEYREVVKSVTYSDVMNRLKTHFDTSNCVLSVVKSSNTEI